MSTRLSVRRALRGVDRGSLALVGLSGGADSLALAAALAAEAHALGIRAGALVVDHGLQARSVEVAEIAASQARGLGLDPVLVTRVRVSEELTQREGPESAAREARYEAFREAAEQTGAAVLLTAHTRDDQAEQVLLALSRGSGTRSVSGIPPIRPLTDRTKLVRPFLAEAPEIRRATTEAACAELGLHPWHDPHNLDDAYARVRVRERLLPALETELGGGVAGGLAQSADLAREDADALDAWAERVAYEVVGVNGAALSTDGSSTGVGSGAGESGPAATIAPDGVAALAALPAAVRQRVIHTAAKRVFGSPLTRTHVLAIAALITEWKGQGPVFVPGIRVTRADGALVFERQHGSPRQSAAEATS